MESEDKLKHQLTSPCSFLVPRIGRVRVSLK
jgi:hypothetical protein